jgi:two-component system chemotaxis sensor kinase CheA
VGTVDRARLAGEAEELVDALGQRLLALEGSGASREIINECFRGVHTIKGLAVAIGNMAVAEVAHRVESLLESCAGEPEIPAPVLDLVHEAAELFARELAGFDGKRRRAATEVIEDLCARLDAATRPADEGAEASKRHLLAGVDPDLLGVLAKRERQHLAEAMSAGTPVVRVLMAWSPQAMRAGVARVKSALGKLGEMIAFVPGPDLPGDDLRLDAVLATGADPTAVTAATTASGARVVAVESIIAGAGRDVDLVRSSSRTVRVDIRKIDALLGAVGELSVLAAGLGTVETGLRHGGAVKAADHLAAELAQLSEYIVELQHGLIGFRMVALRPMMSRLGRVARRIAQSSEKRVRLEVSGAQTEVDKVIVEELSEPLLHLVRNAIDHGIEPAAERQRAGKPAEGTVRIGARQDGSQLVVEVSDDGRGVDVARVRELAVETNLVSAVRAATLDDREVMELLFQRGFSTCSEVNLVSGRGVGLDAVRASIGRLGGVIGISSEHGAGVTFDIRVPITLAMVHGILVRVGDRTFAMPVSGVVESAPVTADELSGAGPRFEIEFRKGRLPAYRIADLLGFEASPGSMIAVVTGVGSGRLGLLVDEIAGAQDIVVKPMPTALSKISYVAGAAELGGRQTVLVLDVPALIAAARDRRDAGV